MQIQSIEQTLDSNLSNPLPKSWMTQLGDEFSKPYMHELKEFLAGELKAGKTLFPPISEMFSAFLACQYNDVKVVIIGQDPYHGPGQAHGMCFSVRPEMKVPPSLRNIYKELNSDLGQAIPEHGYLESWAKQGVLLLNATLTVEKSQAGAHQGKGWEQFTDRVVEVLNQRKEHIVFILWGAYAQKKALGVDRQRHLVLESTHPSPFSAYRGFLGSRPFSKTNTYLEKQGIKPIDWSVPASQ